jgi:iron complex transport system substrate-binding protein
VRIFIRFTILLIFVSSLQAKSIKDLNNQDITVPDKVEAAFGSSPPMNYLLYALNPNKMSGLNFSAKNQNNSADELFLNKKFLSLPVIGSFHGGGGSINLETIIKHNPDLILLWEDDLLIDKVQKEIAKTNIPTITLPFRKIETMPRSIAYAGEAIGEKTRGDMLASYTQNIIDEIKSSLENVKPTKYYYAEGLDGLSTECSVSFHVEALNFSGGENVHKCEQRALLWLEKINFETLLSYDPDIIIAQNTLGWVGLIIPHIVRMAVGPSHRLLIPLSAIVGGAFLLLADAISRLTLSVEIPIGILTSLIGIPIFIIVLKNARAAWN